LYGVITTSSLIRIIASGIDNCGIRDMKLTVGSTNTAGVAITASNSSNVLIDKVVVVSEEVSVQKLRQGIAVGGTAANVKIQDCEVTNISHATGSYGIAAYGTGTVVTGNNVHDCGTLALGGIYVSGSNCIITENNIDTCSGNGGIRVIGDKNIIISNVIQNCDVGILVDATADATTISGNDLDNNTLVITDNGTNTTVIAADDDTYFRGGNVGIGTATPSQPLEVFQADDSLVLITETAGNVAFLGDFGAGTDGQMGLYDAAGGNLDVLLQGGGDSYFQGGKVGIGTASPSANADLTLENGALCFKETTTPTADTDYGKVYTKSDNKLYFQDGAGAEHEIAFV
jgi:parallel beta-helix repeat protein